jgi:molybdate transport system substrate-binding protein
MDVLEKAGSLRSGTRRDLVGNSIVLIAPRDTAVAIDLADPASLAEALGDGKLAMADPETVPAGRYGKAALEYLHTWDKVTGKIAPAENVRAALKLVEAGEAPLGIVYATDAAASARVRIVARFPAASHPPIRYPMAVLAVSNNPRAASFARFLASPRGQAIFARYGFGPAD